MRSIMRSMARSRFSSDLAVPMGTSFATGLLRRVMTISSPPAASTSNLENPWFALRADTDLM